MKSVDKVIIILNIMSTKLTKYLLVVISSYLSTNEIFLKITKLNKKLRNYLAECKNIGASKNLKIKNRHWPSVIDTSYLLKFVNEITFDL